jgi:hypothetical protein
MTKEPIQLYIEYNVNVSDDDHIYKKVVKTLLNGLDLNVSLKISIRDEIFDCDDKILVQSNFRSNKNPNYILSPIWAFLELGNINKALNDNTDFCVKIPKAIWRGSTTGPDEYYKNRSLESRLNLVNISKKNDKMLDAKFTNLVQYVLSRPEKFKIELSKKLDILDQCKYKYIVVADGNVATYGLFWTLASGSVVLKQDSEHIQFIEKKYDRSDIIEMIEPWKHYVPIKRDFSDLIEKIQYLYDNDNIAKEIANNSRKYALKYFNKETFCSFFETCVLDFSSDQIHSV